MNAYLSEWLFSISFISTILFSQSEYINHMYALESALAFNAIYCECKEGKNPVSTIILFVLSFI